jgi:hypothetical protein
MKREQFFAVIDQAQQRTCRVPAAELEETITAVEVVKRAGTISSPALEQLQVPGLADKIVTLMEANDVSLTDLLSGLQEERKAIWRERQ